MSACTAPGWLEKRVNSINWELTMLGIFVFYVVIVFVELALDDPKVCKHMQSCGHQMTHVALVQVVENIETSLLCSLVNAFLWVDLFFMVLFSLEIALQIWVKGAAIVLHCNGHCSPHRCRQTHRHGLPLLASEHS
jgi:hypothetical protein